MRKLYLLALLPLISNTLSAQTNNYCINGRFGEDICFSESKVEIHTNIPYGLADNWYNNKISQQLNSFDIAFPKAAYDDLSKRPFIALYHGGGFYAGDKTKLENFMIQMAQRGYVVATVNYRLGWDSGGADPAECLGDPASLVDAYYRAAQDVNASMRYFIEHANEYGIDTAMIFMGGQSAGVMAVMSNIFLNQTEIDHLYPGESDKFGALNASTNTLDHTFSAKGIINMWGALPDTTYISADEKMPVIGFYGSKDNVVPFNSGPIQECYSPNQYFTVYGSVSIYNRMLHLGAPSVLHDNTFGAHEAYQDDFTVPNTACFLQHVLCGNAASGSFENYTSSCETTLGTGDIADPGTFNIYPNPAGEVAYIDISSFSNEQDIQLELFDATGRQLPLNTSVTGSVIRLEVADLPAGMYMVHLRFADQEGVVRFLKSKK